MLITLLAVFSFSYVFLFMLMDTFVGVYDEGIILTGAMRVSEGDIPHRDFYLNYGPAQFYILSWLFEIFGQKVIVERMLDLFFRAGILIFIFLILVQNCTKKVTFTVSVVALLWLCAVGNHGYPVYACLFFSLFSSYLTLKALNQNFANKYLITSGILTGITAWFRYDVGFFLCVSTLISIAITQYSKNERAEFNQLVKKLFYYALASATPVVILLVWYLKVSAFNDFIHDIITFPIENYAKTRELPFPRPLEISTGAIYFPPAITLAFLIFNFKEKIHFHHQSTSKNQLAIFQNHEIKVLWVFTLLTLFFYLKGIVRVSTEHMQLALIPSLIVLGIMLNGLLAKDNWFKLFVVTLFAITTLSATSYTLKKVFKKNKLENIVISNLSLIGEKQKPRREYSQLSVHHSESENKKINLNLNALFQTKEQFRQQAIDFIISRTKPNSRIFLGLHRHDIVFANDVSAYFQTNRLPATKWHQFDPGLQNSSNIQQDIINDLQKNKPVYVWLDSSWSARHEPNESSLSSGVYLLDGYIKQNYHMIKSFEKIEILERNR